MNLKKFQNTNAVGNFLLISYITVDISCTLKFKFRSQDKNCNMNLTESSMKSYFSKFWKWIWNGSVNRNRPLDRKLPVALWYPGSNWITVNRNSFRVRGGSNFERMLRMVKDVFWFYLKLTFWCQNRRFIDLATISWIPIKETEGNYFPQPTWNLLVHQIWCKSWQLFYVTVLLRNSTSEISRVSILELSLNINIIFNLNTLFGVSSFFV